jgi:hypothetical protein
VSFDERSGVFIVRYDDSQALSPEAQTDLEGALRRASRAAPVGIVFSISPRVTWVDREVPVYWHGITGDQMVRIAAIAVVTTNPAVSVATRAFAAAQILRSTSVAARPFRDEEEALRWVDAEVAKARGVPAAGGPP